MKEREQFDEIFNSYTNGQNRQMGKQLNDLTASKAEFIEYMEELGAGVDEIADLVKIYFRIMER